MEFKRRVRDRISFVLLILGNIAIALSGQNLDCTNDYDASMFCYFEAQNCTEYNLTLRSDYTSEEQLCTFKNCDGGQCWCSLHVSQGFVFGETHTATVWKGAVRVESKIIDTTSTIKPKTPTITSVKESNGNFQVFWKTNSMGSFSDGLYANVTYHKKGDTEKVSKFFKPTHLHGLNSYEILGRNLEPSTTYVVSVRSYTHNSGKFSDSSEEEEFTTPVSTAFLPVVIIISLSFAAVIIGVIYGCCVKLKTKLWDSVAKCPNPKPLDMHHSEQEVLKLMPPIVSSVCVEPFVPDDSKSWSKGSLRDIGSGSLQQSYGASTASSCFSYANTEPADIIAGVQDALVKAFPNISPISPFTTSPLAGSNKDSGLLSSPFNTCDDKLMTADMGSGSSCFDNKTYSILIPSNPHQILTDNSEVQTQSEMLCDSAYSPTAGDIVPCVDQQAPACLLFNSPPDVLSMMPTDMSYRQCNADSHIESLSSVSSGTNTVPSCDPLSGVEAGCDGFVEPAPGGVTRLHGETEGPLICDDNPCYNSVPIGSHTFPPVEDDYQPLQNLVKQPDILVSDKKNEHLNICPEESFTKMPESFLSPVASDFVNNVQGGPCLSELQRPFLSLIPADQPMPLVIDSGYQRV